MVIGGTGRDPWAGWYATLPTAIDITANRYLHLKVWKPRISPTCFKVEGGAGNSGDTYPMTEYSNVGHWEELVYDWTTSPGTGDPVVKPSGEYVKIVLIPDFESPLTITDDVTLYFDDMYVNNDPAVGSAPVQMMEDFSTTEMNIMLGGAEDLSTLTSFVANPDPTGINLSNNVCALFRDKDGVPWDGFWGHVYPPVDVTNNHYVHVKVWKTRISPVFFKLEGGPDGTSERESMYPQTKTNEWEDMVWDYTDFSGAYPIIAFMPDKADPVGLTEDITIYFDDIRVNNSPVSFTPTEQMISVDMNGAGLVEGDSVFVSGAIGGIYGTWNEPGTNLNNLMTDPDGDGIYTITMHLPDGIIAFKFFKNRGWAVGDPFTGGDRTLSVIGSTYVVYTWGVGGVEVSTRKNPLAGKIVMYPNPVRNDLTILTTSDVRKVIITNTLGKVVGNYYYTSNQTLNTRNLNSGMYFVTFISRDGSKVTQKLIKD
jgi:hypothetical protein